MSATDERFGLDMSDSFDRFHTKGRYRFRLGQFLDPNEGLHPEMREQLDDLSPDVPSTLDELIAMQPVSESSLGDVNQSANALNKVKMILDLIEKLETTAAEDLEIALTVVKQLEYIHDSVVRKMLDEKGCDRSEFKSWAVDADRLMHCRNLLEHVKL